MLRWAVQDYNGPVAIRYPRGSDGEFCGTSQSTDGLVCHKSGENVTLLTYGTLINNVMNAAEILDKAGISASVLRLQKIKSLPVEAICKRIPQSGVLVISEEANADAGIAGELALEIGNYRKDIYVKKIDLGHEYVPHGAVDVLYEQYGLSAQGIADFVQEAVNEN